MTGSERGAFFSYRILARFAEVLPLSAIAPVALITGAIGSVFLGDKRKLVTGNLRRVTGHDPTPAQVRRAFVSYARYWLESFRLPTVPREFHGQRVSVDGLEHLQAARDNGKGVILALPHTGNWDAAGAWLVSWGLPLTVVVERLQPPELFTWFADFRRSIGFRVVVNEPGVAHTLVETLKRNEAIALLCDRDVDGTGVGVEFFDDRTLLPKGPAVLALRTGAALLPVATYESGSGHLAVIEEPIRTTRSGTLREDTEAVTQALTHRIEALIRRAPEQWHLFQPNWPSDSR